MSPRPSRAPAPTCHVTANGVALTPRIRAAIRREAARLVRFYERLLEVHVTVTCPHRRPKGQPVQYQVIVRLAVPGNDLVVKRQRCPDLLNAVQASFRAAGRLLQDRARRRQGPPAPRAGAPTATVTRIFPFEGYGFLLDASGEELYFHRNALVEGALERLEPGDRVRYSEARGLKGPQASTVRPVRRRRSAGPVGSPPPGSSRG